MEKQKTQVAFSAKAEENIFQIKIYIYLKGYPETAESFADKLYDFGYTLNNFPDKYPICRFQKLAKRNLRCAVFDRTYILTYKVVKDKLIIYNVIHGKTLK